MPHHEFVTLAGQGAIVSRPARSSTGRLVVVCHGALLTEPEWQFQTHDPAASGTQPMRALIDRLTMRGFVVVTASLSDPSLVFFPGLTYGNDASTDQLDDVITAARALPGVSSADKHGLISISMGALTAANWARRFGQSDLAGILSLLPAVGSMATARGTDAAQGAGYGIYNTAYAALAVSIPTSTNDAFFNTYVYPTYDPSVIAPTIAVPWDLWTNADDTLATPADSVAIAALVPNGKGTHVNMGTSSGFNSGHNFEMIVADDAHELLDTWDWS